jgi:hypothetical protein
VASNIALGNFISIGLASGSLRLPFGLIVERLLDLHQRLLDMRRLNERPARFAGRADPIVALRSE